MAKSAIMCDCSKVLLTHTFISPFDLRGRFVLNVFCISVATFHVITKVKASLRKCLLSDSYSTNSENGRILENRRKGGQVCGRQQCCCFFGGVGISLTRVIQPKGN